MVKQLDTADEFDAMVAEAAKEGKLLLVDFYATWCGPCKTIAPKIVAMADEMKDFCLFAKVDVDENEETAEKYEIQAMPTFLIFANGMKVDSMAGANETKIREMINKNKLWSWTADKLTSQIYDNIPKFWLSNVYFHRKIHYLIKRYIMRMKCL